jgi:type VI secretion system protein ImpL
MISLRRLFGLILLFLFFEAVVALLASMFDLNILACCAAMTGLALAVWVIYIVVTRVLLRPREAAAPPPDTPAPVQSTEPKRSPSLKNEELEALLREANERLAGAPINADRRVKWTVGTLPLYLVVGLESSGKTSTLFNSGVDAKLLAGESYRETAVVPTKLCNFWLASGVVFADVSGRVFSADPEGWASLVRTLGGNRKTSLIERLWRGGGRANNLRGVLYFCDVSAFVGGPDAEKLAALSRKIQDRLQSIGSAFNTDFPVYVIFSKTDAIPYFGEFFGRLSETEDQRIFGATLPDAGPVDRGAVYAESETRRLTGYFNRLYASLADKRLIVLAREDVPGKRPFVYEFPREVKRIRVDLVRFLMDLFRPNPLQPGPRLRGFYFSGIRRVTSAAPFGEKPDEFSVARSGADATVFFRAGQPPAAGTRIVRPASSSEPGVTRWTFVWELFQNVILRDHVAPSSAGGRRFDWYRNAAFASVAVLALILAFVFAHSGSGNRRLLKGVEATVSSVSPQQPAIASLASLQELESLRVQLLPLLHNDREHTSWGLRWGLYSGGHVLPALRDLYFARFRSVILDPSLAALAAGFAQLEPTTPTVGYQEIYDQVKTYRTAASGECRPERSLLERVLPDVWPGARTGDLEAQVLANRQIQFYVSELLVRNPYRDPLPENVPARKKAQDYLLSFKGPDQLLRGLLDDVNRSQPGVDLATYAPDYQKVLTGQTRMEAAYTRAGWDVVQKHIRNGNFASVGETCVVGADRAVGSILKAGASQREIQDLYVRQYIKRWKDFLESEGIVNFGRADADQKLRVLADNNRSPLLALIFMISGNTSFGDAAPGAVPNQVTEHAKRLLPSWLQHSKKVAEAAEQAVNSPPSQTLAVPSDISHAFQPIHFMVEPANQQSWLNGSNRAYIGTLSDLADAIQPISKSPTDVSLYDPARKAVAKAFGTAHQLEGGFNNTPEGVDLDLKNLVEAPIKRAQDLFYDGPGSVINAAARALCAKFDRLRTKYPFDPNATGEVSIPELTAFFAPMTGELWKFQQQAPFNMLLTKSGSAWIQAPGTQPALTPQFLDAFNGLAQFSDLLFPGGSPQPKLRYTVMVTSASKIQAMRVTADGHQTPTDSVHEPFEWPASGTESGARLDVVLSGKSSLPLGVYTGTWAMFRMLQNADSSAGNVFVFSKLRQGKSILEAPTDADGAPIEVRVQVETSGGVNVFAPGYFGRLKCVARPAQ